MQRYAEALHDLDQLDELLESSRDRNDFRLDRAVTLARLQRHVEATAEAAEFLKLNKSGVDQLYKLALVHAISAAAARDTGDQQAEHYAARAVQMLQDAVAKGYKDVESLKKEADFDAVRQRPDFQKLLNDLERGAEEVKP
jgi:hypothetical protein